MRRTALAFAILFLAFTAQAQSGSSAIVGRVTSQGKPLSRATVKIDSDAIQNVRLTRTTNRGTYWAAALPPGTYDITFAHAGTQTVTRKAVVRIGETVRVDADLTPSSEGESVTMTTITRSIVERPQIESSLEPDVVDDLPLAREISSRILLAPGVVGPAIRGSAANLVNVDGVDQHHRGADVEIEDALAGVAVVSTLTTGEFGRFSGGVVLATTRAGGNDLSASWRTTLTSGGWTSAELPDGLQAKSEATVGGRIVRDALWFFLAGQAGDDAAAQRQRTILARLTASPGSHVTLSGSVLRADQPDESRASGDAMLLATARALIDGHADTSRVGAVREHHDSLTVRTLVPSRFGDHALVFGGEDFGSERAAFAGDSWSDGVRWAVSASARYDTEHGTSPRAGIAWDLFGDGQARISATWSRYAGDLDTARESTVAWSQRILTSGFGRVALVRRNYDSGATWRAIEGEARGEYLLFAFGGSLTVGRGVRAGTAWITAMPPGLEQHFTLALLERVRRTAATDVSLQYRFTRARIEPFAKADVLNIFDRPMAVSEDPLGARRALRISIGARL